MRSLREQVLLLLGDYCCRCLATSDLQVHVIIDDGGAHHLWGSCRRWKYYLECARTSDACILCRRCHNHVSYSERQYGRGSEQARRALRPLGPQRFSSTPTGPTSVD